MKSTRLSFRLGGSTLRSVADSALIDAGLSRGDHARMVVDVDE